jgi:monoamine oxidase
VLTPFLGFNKALLDEAILFNRSSCALSNFPSEHAISPEYLETIARDLAAAWREFALGVNALLAAKAQVVFEVATAA